ncbi:MAG: DUF917 domain-containing protein [Pseudomonadota bacterium]
MKTLTRQNLSDILHGAVILGAGGGGELSEGLELIDVALSAGKSFNLVSLDEVPDEALICTPYFLGAVSPMSPEEEARYACLPRSAEHPMLAAYKGFQQHLGREFYGVTPCELGGSNTAAAFFPAAMSGHMLLDADPAGRAVPEITHSTYYLAGLPASPIFAANEFGETIVLDNVCDDRRAETLVRALSQVSRNDIAAIDHALPMRELRSALIEGTITKAMHLGEIWRDAVRNGANAASAVAAASDGFVAFTGVVADCRYETRQGFTLGEIRIAGSGAFAGREARVSVKNENMALWIDGRVFATIPDLICLFDEETGGSISNPDCHGGQQVSLVVLSGPEAFKTENGLEIFGPKYAGIDTEYAWSGS